MIKAKCQDSPPKCPLIVNAPKTDNAIATLTLWRAEIVNHYACETHER